MHENTHAIMEEKQNHKNNKMIGYKNIKWEMLQKTNLIQINIKERLLMKERSYPSSKFLLGMVFPQNYLYKVHYVILAKYHYSSTVHRYW